MDLAAYLSFLVAGLLVLVLPGAVWLAWLSKPEGDPIGQLAEAVGLSLAVNAWVALAAFLAGISFAPLLLVLYFALLGFLALVSLGLRSRHQAFRARLLWRGWLARRHSEGQVSETEESAEPPATRLPSAAYDSRTTLLILLALASLMAWRFIQVRELVLPAWVDSLHHVMIVRLIGETGGLPATFDPYMPVPFYYHFGFHQNAALFSLFSGVDPARAVLVLGQVLNALVALALFRLGMALWGDWRRAGVAALLVGFVSQMPAYYVTWGRYTLLTGLILLLLAMAVVVEIARKGSRRERVARLGLLTAGVILTHYYAALLLAGFYVLMAAFLALSRGYLEPGASRARAITALVLAGSVGVALTAPWILRVWEFASPFTALTNVTPSQSLDTVFFPDYLSYLGFLLGPRRNYLLLALAGLSLLLAGWRRQTLPLAIWTLGLAFFGAPWGPQLYPFRPDHALIVAFIPVGLLVADGLLVIFDRLAGAGLAGWGQTLTAAVLVGLLGWGIRDTVRILNPVTILADQADRRALAWVQVNTSPEAVFFINVTPWQGGIYRGVDGGWWIQPLTGRATLLPPAMYILGSAEFFEETNARAATATALQGCSPDLWGLVERAGISHFYLKAGAGSLKAGDLQACEGLQVVYNQEGVTIYQVAR